VRDLHDGLWEMHELRHHLFQLRVRGAAAELAKRIQNRIEEVVILGKALGHWACVAVSAEAEVESGRRGSRATLG